LNFTASQVFKINESEVFGLAEFKTEKRGVGFNFKLHQPACINLKDFEVFQFKIGDNTYTGKIFVPLGPPPQLGKLIFKKLSHSLTLHSLKSLGDSIVVSIKKTGFHLSFNQIKNWLSLFGTLESSLVYLPHPRKPNLRQDSLEVLMKLRKHILNTLPAYGRKLFVQYRGQPVQCSGCLDSGHMRKECKNPRSNWGSYVRSIFATKKVPEEYFGTWSTYFNVNSTLPVETIESENQNESMDSL